MPKVEKAFGEADSLLLNCVNHIFWQRMRDIRTSEFPSDLPQTCFSILNLEITMSKMNLYLAHLFQPELITQGVTGILKNIWEDWRTQRWKHLSDPMMRTLKADPLCYNKASWGKRYETRIMSARKAAEKYFFRLLKACRDYVIFLSVSAYLPVVSQSRPGPRSSR